MSSMPLAPAEPIDRVLAPLRSFIHSSVAGGVVLIVAAVAAIVWANSPWASSYDDLWHTELGIRIAGFEFMRDLHFWVNDALMAVFFLVVGLEIKREVLVGELASFRRAAFPVAAAAGGAVVPAVLYLVVVGPGSPEARGWGVPMATDIAFALGVLALLGRRAPVALRIFLTAFAIVDDLLAVLVIALFYTGGVEIGALGAAALVFVVLLGANRLGVRNPLVYALLGIALWVAIDASGVHATVAGVLLALTIPARTRIDPGRFMTSVREKLDDFNHDAEETPIADRHAALWELEEVVDHAQAPMLRMEHALHPWVSFLIVPVFALANAGVPLGDDLGRLLGDPVVLGVVLGLVLGKQLGITAFAWLVVRTGIAALPSGVSWQQIYGVAWLGGIGFTMSLFVGELAFADPAALDAAKTGILAASIVSGVGGYLILSVLGSRSTDRDRAADDAGAQQL